MSDLRQQLSNVLGDRYQIERELGRGGMAVVFLARDHKHQRLIALKALRQELAETLAADRFLREIRIAAGLHHPHILALYDSGNADGNLFFVTPYVEGQTVRDRLNRETMLPIDDALNIAEDVLSALSYSHSRNVVHRDIKPDNILLVGQEAIVADFGIARAIEEAAEQQVTQSGLAIGTSAYMAPEQASGELDARSDIYSLGCTLYEMLVGRPPFVGRTAMATLAQHAQVSAAAMRDTRPEIRPELDDLVAKALAKAPRDRFASADEMLAALRLLRTEERSATTLVRPRRVAKSRSIAVAVVVALMAVALFAWQYRDRGEPPLTNAIAVMPFSLSGPVDTSLLSPALAAELLYTRLSGEGGPRVLMPRPALGVIQAGSLRQALPLDELRGAARKSGAGRMVVGRVVAVASRLDVTARLHDVPSGNVLATVSAVGPPDSVLAIFDRLAAQLLIHEVGRAQSQARLASLLSEQLAALRPYLSGIEKYRSGRYEAAVADFNQAIQVDSAFALAAMELSNALAMTGREEGTEVGPQQLAWRHRDRLSPANQLYLSLLLGRRFPAATGYADRIRAWGSAMDTIPDRWEASYFLADLLFHWGAPTDLKEWETLSRNAFERALAADSSLAPVLEHLLELAVLAGDSATLRRMGNRYLAVAPNGDDAPYVRWRIAASVDPQRQQAPLLPHIDSVSTSALSRILYSAQLTGTGLGDALAAADEQRRRADAPAALYFTTWRGRELLFNMGRPGEGLRRSSEPPRQLQLPVDPLFRVIEALYWDGDTIVAATAARDRESHVAGILAVHGVVSQAQAMDLCTVGLWRLHHSQLEGIQRLVTAMRSYPNPLDAGGSSFIELCASMIDAQVATKLRTPDADRRIAYLDSLMRSGPASNPYVVFAANMALAQMFESRRQPARALAAVRRRPYVFGPWGVEGLSSLLREEGRLAVITGDTAGAIKAYEHYLRLREHPELPLVPAVTEVGQTLNRLLQLFRPGN